MQAPVAECHKGTIKEILGKQALVELSSSDGCGACPSHNICHPAGGKPRLVNCQNPDDLPIGTPVKLLYGSSAQLVASIMLFALPVAGLLLGSIVGSSYFHEQIGHQLLVAVITTILAIIPAKLIELRAKKLSANWLPVIKKIEN